MSEQKKPEERKETIGQFMVALLRRKVVPPNDEVVNIVKEKFPESRFGRTHVAWYKSAFKKGRLRGQDGPEQFNQPVGRLRKKPEPEKIPEVKSDADEGVEAPKRPRRKKTPRKARSKSE